MNHQNENLLTYHLADKILNALSYYHQFKNKLRSTEFCEARVSQ